ncbi:ABC transporter permease [Telmatospirillum siberiense]|uniref:ABC transporter permease n=1 Tax=Telmatospirillum siberiense TaxID=382514 RepID=A0A2N3PQJ4_9PROT|nr:ABC transporter permease [Telmatospirillum siberiense]PKU22652.1 ABC transporter permease [Telmatospirillum siberiense]
MLRHILVRLLQSVLILLIMSFLIFGLISLMPGDPVSLMAAASPGMTPEDVARLRALYGFDQSWTIRYGHWLAAVLSGDLGYSRLSAQSVAATLPRPLANSLALMTVSLALALLAAVPAGVIAALRRGRALDHLLNLAAFAAVSLPVFWLGLVAIIVFAVGLGWLPASGVETVGGGGAVDRLRHLALPVLALAVAGFGHYMRYTRSAMIGVLRQDWIRTARAKGLSWTQVVLRHALRSAMIPVVTILALDLGTLFSGIVVTETVFAYPGMGKLIYDAVMGADFNLALAALMLATGLTLAGNLLADCAYGLLDPRIGER